MQLSLIQFNAQNKPIQPNRKYANNKSSNSYFVKNYVDSVSFSGGKTDDFLGDFVAANLSSREEIRDFVDRLGISRLGHIKGSVYAEIVESLRPKIAELRDSEEKLNKRDFGVESFYASERKMLEKEILKANKKEFLDEIYSDPSIQINVITDLLVDKHNVLTGSSSATPCDIMPYLQDKNGAISSRYIDFLRSVLSKKQPMPVENLPYIINSVKDEEGNFSAEKAATFIGCCKMRTVSIDEVLKFMNQLYPSDNSSDVKNKPEALYEILEEGSKDQGKLGSFSFVRSSKLVDLLEQIRQKEESIKQRDIEIREKTSKIPSYRDEVKDKVTANVSMLYDIKIPKKDKYVFLGEQMAVVGDFINNLSNLQGKFLLSFSLADLVLSMRDNDGSISSKSMDFLNKFLDVRKPSVSHLMQLPRVFYAIKDENGNFDTNRSNAFISAYAWPEATLDSAFDFMRKTYGVDFEEINQKLSPHYRSEMTKKDSELRYMQNLIDKLDERTFDDGDKRFGLSIDNDGYLVIDNSRNKYCLQPNWFPELNSNDAFRYISKVKGGLDLLNKESRVTDIGALKEAMNGLYYNKDDNIVGIDQVKAKDRNVR